MERIRRCRLVCKFPVIASHSHCESQARKLSAATRDLQLIFLLTLHCVLSRTDDPDLKSCPPRPPHLSILLICVNRECLDWMEGAGRGGRGSSSNIYAKFTHWIYLYLFICSTVYCTAKSSNFSACLMVGRARLPPDKSNFYIKYLTSS